MYNGARRLHSAYEQDCVVAGWPAAKMQKWKRSANQSENDSGLMMVREMDL